MHELSDVTIEHHGAVAVLTLNRPDSLNAFNSGLRMDFMHAISRINADHNVRVAILTCAGRACAGADLAEGFTGEGAAGGQQTEAMLKTEYKPSVMAIHEAPKPWIAAVNGAAAGIGSAFAMACDLAVMAEDAYLYQAFGAIGLIPDGGATWQLVRTVGRKRAYELIVSGEKVSAARCLELGLCNRVVAAEQLLEQTLSWASTLAEKAPLAMHYAKKSLAFAEEHDLASVISHEAALQHICFDSEDAKEGVTAFFEKRAPVWQGR